jgi:predicted amidophosphoribosyltransferase
MSAVQSAQWLSSASEAFFPSLCLQCHRPLGGQDLGLCPDCWSEVIPVAGASCPICGGQSDSDEEPCLDCHGTSLPQEGTVVWGEYQSTLRAAVVALKHGRRDELAGPLGRRLALRISLEPWASKLDAVTALPSHPLVRLRRGIVAAELLARQVADALGRPCRSLLRRRGTGRQTGKSRAQRLRLSSRSLVAKSDVGGLRVVVVDDVMTTGTTLRRAADVLLGAGARAVYCAALARTPESRSLA